MSKRYPGNFITGNPVALSQTSNNGVWDLKDQYQATGNDTWREGDGNYEIGRSLRFTSSAAEFLSRTPITAGNRRTWTWSAWVKRCNISRGGTAHRSVFAAYVSGNTYSDIAFAGTDQDRLRIYQQTSGGDTWYAESNMFFRDPSAWYHIVVAYDNTLSAAGDRIKLYVNGVQQTFASYTAPAQNTDYSINSVNPHYISRLPDSTGNDMYVAETNFIDGQGLDSSYFGYTDSITGIWYPKKYTGTYGINGFYLPFNDNTNVYGLGNDKKATTSLGSYTTGSLTTSVFKYGGSAFSLASGAYVFPGGLGSGYGIENPMHNVDGKDFTIEFWYKGQASDTNFGSQDGVLTAYNYICSKGRTNTSSNGWGVRLYSNGGVAWETFGASGGNSGSVGWTGGGSEPSVLDNNWHHIAITRASGTVRVFCDGTLRGSGSFNFTCNNTYGITINGMWDYTNGNTLTYKVGGTIDDFRMYTGIAKYTSNFVAPIVPLPIGEGDQYWGYVSCALPFDGTNGSTAIPAWIPNYWTPNNISLTAGSTYDSMVDSPTNVFTPATDIGGVVPGNYPTWNPTFKLPTNNPPNTATFSNGNLQLSSSAGEGSGNSSAVGTMQIPSTGKWYWEVTITGRATLAASRSQIGIIKEAGLFSASLDVAYTDLSNACYVYSGDGSKAVSYGNFSSYGAAWTNGDVIGVACDWDAGTLTFYKGGSSQGVAFSGLSGSDKYFPIAGYFGTYNVNFGQRPFASAPPAGFKSLNTTNLQALGSSAVGTAALSPNKWMDVSLFGGANADIRVQNAGFQPDFVWFKARSNTQGYSLVNSIGGGGEILQSNTAGTPLTGITKPISFNSDGFTSTTDIHTNGYGYAAWQWKQSPTAGFNIVSYLGDGTNNRAISHNLGVTPEFIIVKDRTIAYNWDIYHKSQGIGATFIFASDGTRNASAFGSTAPTPSNFYTQNSYTNSSNSRMIAYLWASVPGFSSFGMYKGNASTDGPFVYTGFRPKFVLIKSVASGGNWQLYDSVRSGTNPLFHNLRPSVTDAENADYASFDFLSNGFKLRHDDSTWTINTSGNNFIYAAFAESPFALNNRAR